MVLTQDIPEAAVAIEALLSVSIKIQGIYEVAVAIKATTAVVIVSVYSGRPLCPPLSDHCQFKAPTTV